jgi:membrane protein DedA with SNARE-associated domain
MGLTAWLFAQATGIIESVGYFGVFVLMVLESMIFPVPSEAVMPFAGFLIADGRMTWTGVFVASTAGSIVGSLLSYAMGYYGGRPLLMKYGKWFLVHEKDLDFTDKFFAKYGSWAVFIARFIPVVRHLISVPAGLAKMRLIPFLISTTVGAALWNMFLAWAGFTMQQHWEKIHEYSHPIDMGVLVVLILGGVWFVWSHIKPLFAKSS